MLGKLSTMASRSALALMLLALGGCNQLELLNPKGDIGAQERTLILMALGIMLAVLIRRTTHSLDPYRPLESSVAPVRVEVVALNWKWLFIYPDYGIATVNRLEIPVSTPIDFKLTSGSIMNSFFIPQLGSQIYAMAGMQTQLHLIASSPGT